jgi:hypothetical protein
MLLRIPIRIPVVLLLLGLDSLASASDKPVIQVGTTADSTGHLVGDVDALYADLKALATDPSQLGLTSSGAILQLSCGVTYRLKAGKPLQFPYQTEMSGCNAYIDVQDLDGNPSPDHIWDSRGLTAAGDRIFADPVTETIVDGSGLGVVNGFPIVAGLYNVFSNFTVLGCAQCSAEMDLGLRLPDNTGRTEVYNVILQGGPRGILFRDPLAIGASSTLIATGNIFRHHVVPGVVYGWGIQEIQNRATSSSLYAELRYNRFYDNKTGLFMPNLGGQYCTTFALSNRNVYEYQGSAAFASGVAIFTRDFGNPEGAHGNTTKLVSIDDAIWNNVGAGGVTIYAALRDTDGYELLNNATQVSFIGTRFVKLTASGSFDGEQNHTSDGRRLDLELDGYVLNAPGLSGPTENNTATVLFRQTVSSLNPTSYDPNPLPFTASQSGTNTVTITGSGVAFDATNVGWNLPSAVVSSPPGDADAN